MSDRFITKTFSYGKGETVSLHRNDEEEFCIFDPPEDFPDSKNVVLFVMRDKKTMDKLAGRLHQVIMQINQHREKCDCG